ncbi:MAG: serine/threonine-protein kinase [Planctomycetota bacterium]|nr:serine/threonine-protein kinase [Planctomycetota bacterium]
MEHLTGRHFGPYRLEKIIGRGGMGTVFLAHEEELDRHVAVKVLSSSLGADRDFVGRFSREARYLASITHPNLIHVYSIGHTEDGYHYMAMEYIKGRTLDDVLKDTDRLSLRRTWQISGQVLGALSAVHSAGLLHRDIKPSNIMLNGNDRAVLMDFGLAKGPRPRASPATA